MSNRWIAVLTVAGTLGAAFVGSGQATAPGAGAQGAPASTPAPVRAGGIIVPTITLGPGLLSVPDYNQVNLPDPAAQVPVLQWQGSVGLACGKTASTGTPEFRVVRARRDAASVRPWRDARHRQKYAISS
jgi:hypothetical protein